MRAKLKKNMVVVCVTVFATTTLQVEAGVIDVADAAIGGVQPLTIIDDTTRFDWLAFGNFSYATSTFSTITAALSGADSQVALNIESTLMPRFRPSISGLRG